MVGLARALSLPEVVALLTLGILARNLDVVTRFLGKAIAILALGRLCVDALRELADGVRSGYSDAGWLRARLAATGSLPDVVREAGELWGRI